MKKIILLLVACVLSVNAYSQVMNAGDLEVYAVKTYGDKWVDAAKKIADHITFDNNNGLTYSEVVDCPGKTKEQLYVLINYWYINTFNDAHSVIQFNDKDLGCIIGQGYVYDIAEHMGGSNAYKVSIKPVIKTDIKDGKIRITYTVPSYEVDIDRNGGIIGQLNGEKPDNITETWSINGCYPFIGKDGHKRTSSKALVMACSYSDIMINKIKDAVQHGINGSDSDW